MAVEADDREWSVAVWHSLVAGEWQVTGWEVYRHELGDDPMIFSWASWGKQLPVELEWFCSQGAPREVLDRLRLTGLPGLV